MTHTLVITAALLVLVSCKPSSKEDPKETSTPEPSDHSSPWTPTDPAILAGREIYEIECSLCHDEGEEGAPRLSSKKQWTKREAKGLDTLISHAINGFDGSNGEMPARGGTKTLTDEEVTNAVKYMIAVPK
ncbi:MAG: c-type cytochrome [Verrucomicrobiaceae bacterium]